MKNKLNFRMYMILVISILAVAAGVYCVFYSLSHSAMLGDIRERANGVKDYIQDTLTVQDFEEMSRDGEAGALTRLEIQEKLNRLRGIGRQRKERHPYHL